MNTLDRNAEPSPESTDTPTPGAPAAPEPGDELQYLLTAYLFESLSPAGREEVEAELARNPQARALLEDLRATLGMLEEAFDADRRRYEFEHRHRMRVMQTAVRSTRGGFGVLRGWRFNWKLWSVAAMLMVAVLGWLMLTAVGDSYGNKRVAMEPDTVTITNLERMAPSDTDSAKIFAGAEDVYRRTDHDADGVLEFKSREAAPPESNAPANGAENLYKRTENGKDLTLVDEVFVRTEGNTRLRAKKDMVTRGNGLTVTSSDIVRKRLEGGAADAKAPAAKNAGQVGQAEREGLGGRYSKRDIAQAQKKAEQGLTPVGGGPGHDPNTSSGAVTSSSGGTSSGAGLFPGGDGGGQNRFDDGVGNFEHYQNPVPSSAPAQKPTRGPANTPAKPRPSMPPVTMPPPPADEPAAPRPMEEASAIGELAVGGKSSVRPARTKEMAEAESAQSALDNDAGQAGEAMKQTKLRAENQKMANEDKRAISERVESPKWVVNDKAEQKLADHNEDDEAMDVPQAQENFDDNIRSDQMGKKNQEIIANQVMILTDDFRKDKGNGDGESQLRAFRHYRADNAHLQLGSFLKHPLSVPPPLITDEGLDEDAFIEKYGTRPFVDARRDAQSTFAMDVDTASYTLARAALNEGRLPDPASVRVEEFVNHFKQDYQCPGDEAFGVFAEGGPAAFGGHADLEMVKIGIKSREPRADERKPAMLTLVIDASGSMGDRARLDQVRVALKGLVRDLKDDDAVCIVTFAATAELTLPRTSARLKHRILDALDSVQPHGASNVEAGLALGYRMADEAYDTRAINRVLLCSDGVANVGPQGPDEILKRVKVYAARGIDLISIGFGGGNYNDKMMERLSNEGNGRCFFVDSAAEAERVFKEQMPAHLDVLARDAKVQVEFNPEVVERYRLLGYENRKIADKDFRNDAIDAGEVAHSTLVTALYEIRRCPGAHGPLGKIYLRWKDATLSHRPVIERNYPLSEGVMGTEPSPELRLLACVAEFAELLRGSRWARDGSYTKLLDEMNRLPQAFKRRADVQELYGLVHRAQQLSVRYWLHEAQHAPQK